MAYRSLKCDGEDTECSDWFSDLHTKVYRHLPKGDGFGIEEVRASVQFAYDN
jgi:UDP-N-acetyl-2-amino-2-deoxyglucuronate dehydrogenase